MSATYLLEHVSAASTSTLETPATVEEGHSGAVWCTEWATQENGSEIVVTAGSDHTVKLWNPLKGSKPMRTISLSCLGIVGMAVNSTETGASFLCTSSIDSVIARFDLEGNPEGRVELGPAESWAISLNPKSSNLATSGMGATVRILSSAKETFGTELSKMDGSGNFGISVEYSPDGRLLGVASDTGYVSLFDAATGALVSAFPAHSAPIRSLQFTSNLLITASDDKRINIFDLRAITGGGSSGGGRKGEVASLGGHEGWVVSVSARNERLLASGSSDGTIKLWDLSNPTTALSTLRDHTGDVWSMSWKPNSSAPLIDGLGGASAGIGGGQLVSAGEDGSLRWWRGGG